MKRAASPGAMPFCNLRKDRNRSKLYGSNIINCRAFFNHYSMFDENDFFMLCAEKYLLNEHELLPLFRIVFVIISQLFDSLFSFAGMSIFRQILIKMMLNEM
jgi:hypothetical protein